MVHEDYDIITMASETEEEIAALKAKIISRELPRLMKLAEETRFFEEELGWKTPGGFTETHKEGYIIGMVYQDIKEMLADPVYLRDWEIEDAPPEHLAHRGVFHVACLLGTDSAAWRALGEEE